MRRRVTWIVVCLSVLSASCPSVVLSASPQPTAETAGPWSLSVSSDRVHVALISQSDSEARIALESDVGIKPSGQFSGQLLKALGLSEGYSQHADWEPAGGPEIQCPGDAADPAMGCLSGATGGSVLIPDGVRIELRLVAPTASGSTTIIVAPDLGSFAYDSAVTAIGIALTALEPNGGEYDIGMIHRLATQLLPECAGIRSAMGRGDLAEASWELLSVARRAAEIILEHSGDWGIPWKETELLNMMGPLEIKLGLATTRAVGVLANLDVCLLSSCATTVVATYASPPFPAPTASVPTPTPTLTPEPTPETIPSSPAIPASLFGEWVLAFSGVSTGCPTGYKDQCYSFTSGGSFNVSESSNVLSASGLDTNGNAYTVVGKQSGSKVTFTISGNGITGGIGNATTTYTGTVAGYQITGTFTGRGRGWPENLGVLASWSGDFVVMIYQ